MQKVVAFLEKYAQWLAMGVAGLFLLFVVYSYWVSPDQLKVKVGNETLLPGEVDTTISNGPAANLKRQMEAGASSATEFKVPDIKAAFAEAMSGQGDPVKFAGAVMRPAIPREGPVTETVVTKTDDKISLPKVPAPTPIGITAGQSLIGPPVEVAEGEAQPQVDPNVALANAIQKDWATIEAKLSGADFAKVWDKAFTAAAALPDEAKLTQFYLVEVQRQELIGPDKWSEPVLLKPLALVKLMDFPRNGDVQEEANYKVWSEKHQVDLIEPIFYTVLKGDPWSISSRPAKVAGAENVPVVADNQPFDPANPPNRELTPQEKQQVYIYKQKKAQEEQKQKADAAKSKAAAAQQEQKNRGTGGGGANPGGRRTGYAPLPPVMGAPPLGREGLSGEDNSRRPIPNRPIPGREGPDAGRPMFEGGPNSMIQGGAPQGPFDPTKLAADGKNPANDITIWAHDDTVVPGKTYRYRMRIYIKNPLYQTVNAAKNPADEKAFAIVSDWSEWTKQYAVPSTTLFQFAMAKQSLKDKVVTSATVNVFKREKGDWTMETFSVAPGDSIGSTKNNIDFTTGATLVDLRQDPKDVRIIIADELGELGTRMLNSDANDPFFKDLIQRIKNANAAAAAGATGEGGNPALTNPVGTPRF